MTSINLGSMKLIWDHYEWFETLSFDIDLESIGTDFRSIRVI